MKLDEARALKEKLKIKIMTPEERHAAVQKEAYFLWLSAGKPAGRDAEFWLKAEKKLDG